MKKIIKNQKGIAHLGLIVGIVAGVLVIAGVGYRVSQSGKSSDQQDSKQKTSKVQVKPIDKTIKEVQNAPKNKQGSVGGTFVQPNNATWPAGQPVVYIGLNAGDGKNVSKVEWYLTANTESTLKHTVTKPDVGNLFQYNWNVEGLPAGTYRWIVKVYDAKGNIQLAKNNNGDPYLDTALTNVETPGTVSGTFVQPNDATWPTGQREIYIGLNSSDSKSVSKVEWYVNGVKPEALQYTATRSAAENLYQYSWNVQGMASGKYRVQVKIYDLNGNFQMVKNRNGDPYLDTNIVN